MLIGSFSAVILPSPVVGKYLTLVCAFVSCVPSSEGRDGKYLNMRFSPFVFRPL